jgi:hypothetical protein
MNRYQATWNPDEPLRNMQTMTFSLWTHQRLPLQRTPLAHLLPLIPPLAVQPRAAVSQVPASCLYTCIWSHCVSTLPRAVYMYFTLTASVGFSVPLYTCVSEACACLAAFLYYWLYRDCALTPVTNCIPACLTVFLVPRGMCLCECETDLQQWDRLSVGFSQWLSGYRWKWR